MSARLLTASETAELLAVSEGTLANWRTSGGGPAFVKVGRAVRYSPKVVDAWLRSRTMSRTPIPQIRRAS